MLSVSVVKEDFAPPPSGMPGQFPVYLRLPYRRDSYFCFKQQDKQDAFLAILSDCIRHQNQGETMSPSRPSRPATILTISLRFSWALLWAGLQTDFMKLFVYPVRISGVLTG